MICPICGGKTKVKDSRERKKSTYRSRQCLECGNIYATYEVECEEYKRFKKIIDMVKP